MTKAGDSDAQLWALLIIPPIEKDVSGIYSWTVDGAGTYVGKSCDLKSRLREYRNNVRKMVLGRPYRRSGSGGFRWIHHELLAGLSTTRHITCEIVERCDRSLLNDREQYWIAERGTLNGRNTNRLKSEERLMIQFNDDDSSYLDWIKRNPEGYVLNVRDRPDPHYVVLHRATCKTISRDLTNPAGYTGASYRKVVAGTKDSLRGAAVKQGRLDKTFSRECAHCSP